MSITDSTIEELLSQMHVGAIIAQSGATVSRIETDYGVDLTVRQVEEIHGKRIDIGPVCDIQLKATINWKSNPKQVIYDMDVEAHNKLIDRNRYRASIYCLLVVCCLPKEKSKWVNASEEQLILRNCCYYKLLEGPLSSNKSTTRVKIPRSQLLTPFRASALLKLVKSGGIA